MRKSLLLVLGLLLLPGVAAAQPPFCADCTMGLYDGVDLRNNFGSMAPGEPKDIYLGIHLGAGETGVTGVEFSVAGLRDGLLVLSTEAITPWSVAIGSPAAPADTSSTDPGTVGGMNIAWAGCVAPAPPSRALPLAKIQILSFSPVVNRVFQVKRKYQPSSPNFRSPLLVRCDGPVFTAVMVKGGCYIAGFDGNVPPSCQVGVEPNTWSGVKQLFH